MIFGTQGILNAGRSGLAYNPVFTIYDRYRVSKKSFFKRFSVSHIVEMWDPGS
jgi:hypothetical protein